MSPMGDWHRTKEQAGSRCKQELVNHRLVTTVAGSATGPWGNAFHTNYIGNAATATPANNFGIFGRTQAISISSVQFPATTIAITDGAVTFITTPPYVDRNTRQGAAYLLVPPDSGLTPGAYGGPHDRHLDTVMVGYVDGHVKSVRLDSFYKPATPALDRTTGG